jgi:hypothetical protein
MTIFICWSGTRSRAIAEAVEDLLKDCGVDDKKIDRSDHIEKGTVWSDWIRDRLRDAKAGIVCLTPENVRSPWMHFEAGALAVGLSPKSKDLPGDFDQRRLFTLLHGVTGAEINGPLSAYQATSTTRREMAQMVSAIKSILDIKPADKAFPDDAWNKFESALKRATIPVGELISDLGQTLQRKTFTSLCTAVPIRLGSRGTGALD